jgi:hypothetical protein
MNGCQYMRPSFTLPASANASQIRWDFGTLSEKEFVEKYPVLKEFYARLAAGTMKLE